MLESVVATRQLWRWVPPWRYGLESLMKCVRNVLICNLPKTQFSIMIWLCCSRPWILWGFALRSVKKLALSDEHLWMSSRETRLIRAMKMACILCTANHDSIHKDGTSMWHRSSSWNFLFITSNHKKIQVSFSEKLTKSSYITLGQRKLAPFSLVKWLFNFIDSELQKQENKLSLPKKLSCILKFRSSPDNETFNL